MKRASFAGGCSAVVPNRSGSTLAARHVGELKPVAVGRKNFLFAAPDEGRRSW
jgi:hypothetical protein